MPKKRRSVGRTSGVSKTRHRLESNHGSKPKALRRGKGGKRNGGSTHPAARKTFREAIDTAPPVAEAPSFTAEAVRTLISEIKDLAREEAAILDNLDLGASSGAGLPELEQAASDLTRINDKIVAKTNQLPARADLDKYLAAETELDEYTRNLLRRDKSVWNDRDLLPQLRSVIAQRVMAARAKRPRARRAAPVRPDAGSSSTGEAATDLYSPTPIEHHDVLMIAPLGVHTDEELYRFPFVKNVTAASNEAARAATKAVRGAGVDSDERVGQYRDTPELLDAFDEGQRRTLSIARPQDWGPACVRATQRGPAFATLPIKPEPEPAAGVESSQCYLINAQNLNFRNAWTAEEWNDTPGGVDLPPAQGAMKDELEALLAGPQGKVFRLQLTNISEWEPRTSARIVATFTGDASIQRELGTIESVDLRPHMEVWQQLRGGTAMGRVYFDDASGCRVIPLVNITTLTQD